jgi:hypothetical protein
MTEKNLFISYTQIISAIDFCISEKLIMPALILLYSAIDSISWIASDDENQPVGKRFSIWVNTWMLQKYPLPCTANELYAARCGILHTLTPVSDLSEKKQVNQISYAWGTAKQKDLDESIKLLDYPSLVAVHIDDIFHSFRNGFADFIESLEEDDNKKALFTHKAGKHFAYLEMSLISEVLAAAKKDGG